MPTRRKTAAAPRADRSKTSSNAAAGSKATTRSAIGSSADRDNRSTKGPDRALPVCYECGVRCMRALSKPSLSASANSACTASSGIAGSRATSRSALRSGLPISAQL